MIDHRYNFISRTTIWYVEVTSIRPMMNESVLSQIKLAQQLCVDLFRFKEFIIIPLYSLFEIQLNRKIAKSGNIECRTKLNIDN